MSHESGFRAVLDALPDAVAVHRADRILYVNAAFAQMFGYDRPEALVSAPMSGLLRFHLHPDAVAAESARPRLTPPPAARDTPVVARRFRRLDGTLVVAEAFSLPVAFEGAPAVVSLIRDVTDRQGLQARLAAADRLASVGQLAAGVAHEINNPLTYVTANLGFAAEHALHVGEAIGALPEEAVEPAAAAAMQAEIDEIRQALAEASQGANRVRQIVRDLRTFARPQEDTRRRIEVKRLVESCINMAWNEIRHRARLVKLYDEVPPVAASESRLAQVFLNLLVNAAQAIPAGYADSNEIHVVIRKGEDGQVVVEIRDTGIGIPPENLGRIFDPFFTTKPAGEGTGLGLAIVHDLVTALGGKLTVDSQVDRGSTFRVSLPPAGPDVPVTGVYQVLAAPARRGRVLVVDDEPFVLRAVARLLAKEHDVVTAGSGTEALRRILEGERFEAILCDLMMPEMTGVELHAEIQRQKPDLAERMVFLTGGAFTPAMQAFLDAEPDRVVLEKPVDLPTLRAVLARFVT